MTGVLDQALACAAAGWPVFPCRPNNPDCRDQPCRRCKAPLTEHGFEDATTDPDRIRAWWTASPARNVAIATGAPGPDVLDVDVKAGGSGWPALRRLKRAGLLTGAARLIRTPSGGAHVYFAGTGQGCHALPRHYLDFKSRGGYVLAPPSVVHGKPYILLDQRDTDRPLDWRVLKELLDPPRPVRARAATWDGGELPPGVQRALAADDTDRSAALHRLIGACARAGLDEAAIHQIAGTYQPALEKYGARLPAEIERSLRKIGAA